MHRIKHLIAVTVCLAVFGTAFTLSVSAEEMSDIESATSVTEFALKAKDTETKLIGEDGIEPPTADPDGEDGTEPPVTDPDGEDGTEPPVTDPDGEDGTEPPVTDPDGEDGTEPPVTDTDDETDGLVPPLDNAIEDVADVPENQAAVQNGWGTGEDANKYFENGVMVTSAERCINGNWYYFHADGHMATGATVLPDGRIIDYGTDGVMRAGSGLTQSEDGKWYYLEGLGGYKTGEFSNGNWYYFHPDGHMATGATWLPDGRLINYGTNGMMLPGNGLTQSEDGKWYYLVGVGGYQTGEIMINQAWHYFYPVLAYMATGETQLADGRIMYYDENGVMQLGLVEYGGNTYYYDEYGKATSREQSIDGNWYYFQNDGHMATDITKLADGRIMNYGTDGILQPGNGLTQAGDGKWYYLVGVGGYKSGEVMLDGAWHYFFPVEGYMAIGETTLADGRVMYYDQSGAMQLGFVSYNGKTYYYDAGGKAVGREQSVGGNWYYFHNDGHMATGATILPDGRIIDYGTNGIMKAGSGLTQSEDGKWYYLVGVGGFMTGEVMDGGWRYFYADGHMATGAAKLPDGRVMNYGPDGLLREGNGLTQAEDGKWYYLVGVGGYKTGEVMIDGKWHYFVIPDGYMAIGEVRLADGRLMYYDSTGAMVLGFVELNGSLYYYDAAGKAVSCQKQINGEWWIFDAYGIGSRMEAMKGIDVSSVQGVIDWNKVKADGVSFVIVRAMHWDNKANNYVMDSMFVQNVMGAKSVGLLVGAYWFSEAFNGAEALAEVQFIANSSEWNALKNSGVILDMPFFIDYEDKNWLDKHTTYESRTEAVRTGMDAVEQILGTQSGFYTSDSYAQNWFNGQQLINEGYNAWIARWSSSSPATNGYMMWQYSNVGQVNGISGNVDLNHCYKTYTFHPVNDYTGGYTTITVYDINTGKQVTGNITELTKQIVANEVGGGLGLTGAGERAELYKAQAVAAHSYLVYMLNRGMVPQVGLKAYSGYSGLSEAVEAVKNEVIVYNGAVINAVYTSCSGSYTNSAANMGWTSVPYLTSVESKYDSQMAGAAKYYPRTSTIPIEDYYGSSGTLQSGMRSNIIKMVGQQQYSAYANNPELWITEIHTDAHGNIDYAIVCGVKVSGGTFYENCWGLYGANLTSWKYNGSNWTFVSNGNGHGVGMSQYGAAGYIAKESWNYKQILEHYYAGAKVV